MDPDAQAGYDLAWYAVIADLLVVPGHRPIDARIAVDVGLANSSLGAVYGRHIAALARSRELRVPMAEFVDHLRSMMRAYVAGDHQGLVLRCDEAQRAQILALDGVYLAFQKATLGLFLPVILAALDQPSISLKHIEKSPDLPRCRSSPDGFTFCDAVLMETQKLLRMSNHEVETRAIQHVIALERAFGRTARDTRHEPGSRVDVESVDEETGAVRHIEVKAFGGAGRGDDLWLENAQVAALESPDTADPHLYLVTHVRSADPDQITVLDLCGEELSAALERKRCRSYYSVSLPVAAYDALARTSESEGWGPAPAIDGTEFILRLLEAVTVLHARGETGVHFAAAFAPNGLHVRVSIGTAPESPSGPGLHPHEIEGLQDSLGNERLSIRGFAGLPIPSTWDVDRLADELLARLPAHEDSDIDADHVAATQALLERHRADRSLPLTVVEAT